METKVKTTVGCLIGPFIFVLFILPLNGFGTDGGIIIDDPARSKWILGFRHLERAENSEQLGKISEAVDAYREANKIFKDVAKHHPAWNPAILNYRISYCTDKIGDLSDDLKTNISLDAADSTDENPAHLKERLRLANDRINTLESKLVQLNNTLDKGSGGSDQFAILIRENEKILNENRKLSEKTLILQRQLTATVNDKRSMTGGLANEQVIVMLNRDLDKQKNEQVRLSKFNHQLEDTIAGQNEKIKQASLRNRELESDLDLKETILQRLETNLAQAEFTLLKERDALKRSSQMTMELLEEIEKLRSDRLKLEDALGKFNDQNFAVSNHDEVPLTPLHSTITQLTRTLKNSQLEIIDCFANLQREKKNTEKSSKELRIVNNDLSSQKKISESLRAELDIVQEANFELRENIRRLNAQFEQRIKGEKQAQLDLLELKKEFDNRRKKEKILQDNHDLHVKLYKDLEEKNRRLQTELLEINRTTRSKRELPDSKVYKGKTQITDSDWQSDGAPEGVTARPGKIETESSRIEDAVTSSDRIGVATKESDSSNHPGEFSKAAETRSRANDIVIRLLDEANECEASGNRSAMRTRFHELLRLDPDNIIALSRLADSYIESGEIGVAEKYLTHLTDISPDDPENFLILAYVLSQVGKHDSAIAMLKRAIILKPDNPNYYRLLGVSYYVVGETAAAEIHLKKSFSLNNAHPETAYNLAVLYAGLPRPKLKDAKKWYTMALNLGAPNDANLDRLFAKQNNKNM